MTSGRLREVKNKNKSLKVVAVTYKRWSLTRGSNYSDLTGHILVFWKSGSSREAVAYERWSQEEVRLYEVLNLNECSVYASTKSAKMLQLSHTENLD